MTVIRYIVFQIWSATDKILSFWTIFFPFTPQTAWKIKIFWKRKKNLEISSLYVCVPKIMFRWHTVPEIWCMTDVIVTSHFGLFFPLLYTLLKLKKSKFSKNEKKNTWRYHNFICVPKIMIRWCMVPEMWCMTHVIIFHFRPFFALLSP